MSATDWFVVAGALAAIAWVNWYFFLADRRGPASKPTGAVPLQKGSGPPRHDR